MLHWIQKSKKRCFSLIELLIVTIIIIFLFVLLIVFLIRAKKNSNIILYHNDLKLLYRAIQQYSKDFDNQYPISNKWCDLLIKYTGVPEGTFHAFESGDPQGYATIDPNDEPNYPVQVKLVREYDDDEGKHWYEYYIRWSHYAINPNANLDSPGDTVLVFETKGGWNQFGGPEIFSSENYKGRGRVGGYVLFNDGTIKFVRPRNLSKLNWGKDN